jgi:pimeloyl-ACP methyl ester carboxylesterase
MNRDARPTLLLLPGTLCDERLFVRQRRALRLMARIEVGNLHTLDEPAAWVARLLERLPPRFSVAGFSLGGLLALEILRQAPSRVERLALVASNARGASLRGQRRSAQLWRRWRVGGPQGVMQDALPQYFPKPAQRRRHRGLIADMARCTPGPAAKAQFQWAAARPEGRSVLSGFAGPLCVVSGMRDKLCPHAWQQEIVAIHPRAQWTALPRVGHFLPLEASAPLSRALTHWLQSPVTDSLEPSPSDPYV